MDLDLSFISLIPILHIYSVAKTLFWPETSREQRAYFCYIFEKLLLFPILLSVLVQLLISYCLYSCNRTSWAIFLFSAYSNTPDKRSILFLTLDSSVSLFCLLKSLWGSPLPKKASMTCHNSLYSLTLSHTPTTHKNYIICHWTDIPNFLSMFSTSKLS